MQKLDYFRLCGSSEKLGSSVDECLTAFCQSNKVPGWAAFPDRTTAVLPIPWQETLPGHSLYIQNYTRLCARKRCWEVLTLPSVTPPASSTKWQTFECSRVPELWAFFFLSLLFFFLIKPKSAKMFFSAQVDQKIIKKNHITLVI